MKTEKELLQILNELGQKTPQKITINIPVKINGRLKTTLGRVKYEYFVKAAPIKIEFSKLFLETATEKQIMQTIIHEFCYYYLMVTTGEPYGHDKVFKDLCLFLGCYENTTRSQEYTIPQTSFKYLIYCPTCGNITASRQRACTLTKHPEFYKTKCCNSIPIVKQQW